MISKAEAYRLNMLRQAQNDYEEAEQAAAKAREKQLSASQVIANASLALPTPDACPSCWCRHGMHSTMAAMPGGERRQDVMGCRTCGYQELVEK
jgi:hypothetical protein